MRTYTSCSVLKYSVEQQSWSLSQPPTLRPRLRLPGPPVRHPSPFHRGTVSLARRCASGWQGPPDCFGSAPGASGAGGLEQWADHAGPGGLGQGRGAKAMEATKDAEQRFTVRDFSEDHAGSIVVAGFGQE